MKGIAYGVGVGPGDPELMTLKACRLIRENEVIAVPGKIVEETVAYKIALGAVPELKNKTLLPLYMPMVHDHTVLKENHLKCAKQIEEYLEKGQNVVFLTLGDSSVYCTFTYLQAIIEADGYKTQLVSGITSFCAAAARLNIPLVEWNEGLHVVPGVHKLGTKFDQPGNYVIMKSGSHMNEVKRQLEASGRDVSVVVNCGMENEQVYHGVDSIPDDAGYFSLIIAKEPNSK